MAWKGVGVLRACLGCITFFISYFFLAGVQDAVGQD